MSANDTVDKFLYNKAGEVTHRLADWAFWNNEDFAQMGGCCSCHISPPCYWCTHPGNPLNIAESDDAYVPVRQKLRVSSDVPMTDAYRKEVDDWLLTMFGFDDAAIDAQKGGE